MSTSNRGWILENRPVGNDFAAALKLREIPVPQPGDGEVLLKTRLISLDPANRLWMSDEPSYIPPLPLGKPMWGGIIGEVVESRSAGLAPGDLVSAQGNWCDYCVAPAGVVGKITPIEGIPLEAWISALGFVGWTAYFGLLDVGKPRAGETLVISGAAGAVGSMVGQIAKIKGLTVIGIAGSQAKCAWLTESLGFDHAIDYSSEDVGSRLKALAPPRSALDGGVDLYFENVGGAIGNAVFDNLADRARVMLCGLISQYNDVDQPLGANLSKILMRRASITGFLVSDYVDRAGEAIADLAQWMLEGRLISQLDVVDGLENTLTAFSSLFQRGGGHTGKLVVRLDP